MFHPDPASKQTITPIKTPGNCQSSCNNISCSLLSAHSKVQLMFFCFIMMMWSIYIEQKSGVLQQED
jgi:hypothetical protein